MLSGKDLENRVLNEISKPRKDSRQASTQTVKAVLTLWQRFAESSQWWVQKMGESEIAGEINPAIITWAMALDEFTPAQIGEGFRRWLDSGKGIPDLPEFKACCRKDEGELHPMTNRWRRDRALVDECQKAKNRVAASAALSQMKANLNG